MIATSPYEGILTRLVAQHLHGHPELSFQEVRTQTTLRDFLLHEANVPAAKIQACAGTGLVVDFDGPIDASTPGTRALRCIAFRGDMDALPITECNPHLAYASTVAGAAHMCGHDGHMTSLAGLAWFLQRATLPPNTRVRLLFQPAEEGHFGAVQMIQDGCLDGVDEVYGYHNAPFRLGHVHVKPGPIMSHGCKFAISVMGPGGHGSAPYATTDPVLAAGHIVVAMQSLVSRNIPAGESAIVTIATIHGGEADNVIPSRVTMTGTYRDFNPAMADIIETRMRGIVENTAAAYGTIGRITFDDCYPVTVNAPDQAGIVADVAARVAGKSCVSDDGLPLCASEDFSYYLQKRPGCFFMLGTTVDGEEQNRQLHSDTYDFNDGVLPLAIRLFLEVAQNRLGAALMSPEALTSIYEPKGQC
ncbi:hypothetical protein SPRG_11044 [Saprolegnia parasitica CBS 223.65]|uniref:Peptidase M20 dimerisation domain-containing protein n=1 Tax=Saprolegnia parasitica (strain CBS 223.65) TaxID=695850 RepID=A0A067BWK4_SAPPC|nr:hypothetical protein SPRG_11044 [Saprolegnia parasitica CBS 223.65]KDO21185.1 hypothetical protein SPRG_11044 [Saprolegnia parasitica CBS 223.65]|eukprot:XP_012208095.1 hypothetical protein SPRG_11044 [Saprolegnia parasitica CBS 223.65]